jgi:integrase-like protein
VSDNPSASAPRLEAPKLLDQVRTRLRLKHYSLRTEAAYVGWIRRYILFHDRRHPREMGKWEVEAFLSALAVERNVSAATQTQALSALLFLRMRRDVGSSLAFCPRDPVALITYRRG